MRQQLREFLCHWPHIHKVLKRDKFALMSLMLVLLQTHFNIKPHVYLTVAVTLCVFLVELHEGDVQVPVEELWEGAEYRCWHPETHPHHPSGVTRQHAHMPYRSYSPLKASLSLSLWPLQPASLSKQQINSWWIIATVTLPALIVGGEVTGERKMSMVEHNDITHLFWHPIKLGPLCPTLIYCRWWCLVGFKININVKGGQESCVVTSTYFT